MGGSYGRRNAAGRRRRRRRGRNAPGIGVFLDLLPPGLGKREP
jgi:hypothetical protein